MLSFSNFFSDKLKNESNEKLIDQINNLKEDHLRQKNFKTMIKNKKKII